MSFNESTAIVALPARARRFRRTSVLIAALGIAVSPFGSLAVAAATYDADWYDWCMSNLDEGSDYCCEHAGGVVRQGACINPDALLQPTAAEAGPATPSTKRPLPDAVGPTFTQVAPAGPTTATNPRAPIGGLPTAVMAP